MWCVNYQPPFWTTDPVWPSMRMGSPFESGSSQGLFLLFSQGVSLRHTLAHFKYLETILVYVRLLCDNVP